MKRSVQNTCLWEEKLWRSSSATSSSINKNASLEEEGGSSSTSSGMSTIRHQMDRYKPLSMQEIVNVALHGHPQLSQSAGHGSSNNSGEPSSSSCPHTIEGEEVEHTSSLT
jgi:hypothetical protein